MGRSGTGFLLVFGQELLLSGSFRNSTRKADKVEIVQAITDELKRNNVNNVTIRYDTIKEKVIIVKLDSSDVYKWRSPSFWTILLNPERQIVLEEIKRKKKLASPTISQVAVFYP